MIYSISMLSICTKGHERYRKEYEELVLASNLLSKHDFVDVRYRQNPVLFNPSGIFAKEPRDSLL